MLGRFHGNCFVSWLVVEIIPNTQNRHVGDIDADKVVSAHQQPPCQPGLMQPAVWRSLLSFKLPNAAGGSSRLMPFPQSSCREVYFVTSINFKAVAPAWCQAVFW